MRLSSFHAPTLREAPREAEIASHRLLIRAGFIRQLSAGIYNLMPLGVRTVSKISAIIREEMNAAGAQEVLMPAVQPAELWQQSGRWEKYGPELLRFQDRKGNDFCLGPTHEEVIVDLVRRDVASYRALPLNLYQIQSKFRDEIRPRAGLMRGREFIMKDAYSFDQDEASAKQSYERMFNAYQAIFTRCGLDFRAVEADTGNIGGSLSHEFQVLAETGEDAIVSCTDCTYTANVEMAEIAVSDSAPEAGAGGVFKSVDTPGQRTVAEVTGFLEVSAKSLIKTLIIEADGRPWAALVRGDRELNTIKVKRALDVEEVIMAADAKVVSLTGAPVGFAGPVGLDLPIIADPEVLAIATAVCGANKGDAHLVDVVAGADFIPQMTEDIRLAVDGDSCSRCGATLRAFRGIEVGHVFYLGTKYSEPMNCTFLDQNGKDKPMVMGCYGIGVTRIMAAAVEQHHDDRGIVWPIPLAPFSVALLALGKPGDPVFEAADGIYQALCEAGIEVVFDDRKDRPGAKFADAELMGFPLQIVVGKRGLENRVVEFKDRRNQSNIELPMDQIVSHVNELVIGALR